MDVYQLRYFVAVAEELSFRRAAERLHITRPPLTRQIAALESEIKARLLERDRRSAISLTDAGHAFLIHAKCALQHVEDAGKYARRAAHGSAGRLTITGCALLAAPALVTCFQEFRRAFPLVEVSFIEASRTQELKALRENSAHLAISANFGEKVKSGFCTKMLGTVFLSVLFPCGHPLAQCPEQPVDLEDLQQEVLLCPSLDSKPSYSECLDEICAVTGFVPHDVRQIDGVDNVAGMVAAGYGVAIVAENPANSSIRGCEVKRLRMPLPPYRLRMLWRREVNSPLLQNFLAVAKRVQMPKQSHPSLV